MAQPVRVFVSHSFGTDPTPLFNVLEELGLDPIKWKEFALSGRTIQEETTELVRSADLVLLVTTRNTSPSVYVEAGVALGMGKPLLVIGGESVPSDLAGMMHIKASPQDTKALKFHLQSVLDNWEEFVRPRHELDEPATQRRSSKSRRSSSELDSELERRTYEALQKSLEIESVVSQAGVSDEASFIPDIAFAIPRSDYFQDGLMIVEVKYSADMATVSNATRQLVVYCEKANAIAGLLVLGNDDSNEICVLSPSPLIFKLEIEHLENLVASGKLLSSLRRARNLFVHSVA